METIKEVLICGVLPYFIEKDKSWFENHLTEILEATQKNPFFKQNVIHLEVKKNQNFSEFLRKLDEMGYEKVWEVSSMGEFSQKGGIVDIFPVNLDFLVKIEFFGNRVENIWKIETKQENAKEILKKKLKSQKIFSDLRGLKKGDYLVHIDHGVGKFCGFKKFKDPTKKEKRLTYYVIEYSGGDKIYVPFGLESKLMPYFGFSNPRISKLGSLSWIKTKNRVRKEAEKFAKELFKIYLQRELVKRKPYLPEDEIDKILESSFEYEETPDQIKAIEDVKKDLESEKPTDRLICGDVGFGKTEVALRAAVKVAKSSYQVIFLVPTTILANQHYLNFKKRCQNLPFSIEMLCRLQPKNVQKEIIKRFNEGKIDILIATHKIFSKEIDFSRVGLLIIDDEHKFGVAQKEALKKINPKLDVISMSATPIPRTLYFSLCSLRKISLIQTPPLGRLPVKTYVLPFDEKLIKEAILKELERGGQVYYLHNRIENIKNVKNWLSFLVPQAKFGIAHGKLREKELVKIMDDFWNKKIDVLVATTIIEAGLDFPNVNTLIVAESTKLGLAQAYQIRGRIGRSFKQAFAFFLYSGKLRGKAKLRLKYLKEAENLGSGYKIALKDLEMRGAGNILGKEQWGNVNRVGLNLYCQMLSLAIEKLKKNHDGNKRNFN
jgi:transcription-repair coupling factor (superfamily II helicase)